ncbi:hypothetical protein ISN44_As12g038130 [Arabidopsis suecica]|uniref:Uncharacterized protein n=1 Tax=Arabidopsis suecica TaxID=45249 RepID=A0A8T1YQV5_ARASU|nr:hypothetical protein ISN44_As12g038130 [Arabidopsis suecica]
MPPLALSSPVFRPDPLDFMPGSVQFPLAMVSALPSHSWAIGSFHDALVDQHRANARRHAELVEEMQRMEMGMRRLEADPVDWERFELACLHPMPMIEWCRTEQAIIRARRGNHGGR